MRCILFFLLLSVIPSRAQITTVNPVIGNESFVATFGREPNDTDSDWLRIRTHLAYAEQILRLNEPENLSPDLRAKRLHLLDLLHDYVARGQFPKNEDHPEERRPCFIDGDGTICAVGYLVEQTEGRDKAEMINTNFQYATITEMDSDWLRGWLQRWGLSATEAATIQPTYDWGPRYRIVLPRWYQEMTPINGIYDKINTPPSQGQVLDSTRVHFTLSKKGKTRIKSISGKDEQYTKLVSASILEENYQPVYHSRILVRTLPRFSSSAYHYTFIRHLVTDSVNLKTDYTSYNTLGNRQDIATDSATINMSFQYYTRGSHTILVKVVDEKNQMLYRDTIFIPHENDTYRFSRTVRIALKGSNRVRIISIMQGNPGASTGTIQLYKEGNYQVHFPGYMSRASRDTHGDVVQQVDFYCWPEEMFTGKK